MPDPDDDLLRTTLEQAAELDRDADQLADAAAVHDRHPRIGMSVDTVGTCELSAYELAKAEAARLLSWSGLHEARLDANEPETTPSGAIQVGGLVGVTMRAAACGSRTDAGLAGRERGRPVAGS